MSDLPGPLKCPLAAMLVPKTPTERTSASGRGVGVGEGVDEGEATAPAGDSLADGNSGVEQAVRAANDNASSLTPTQRKDCSTGTLGAMRIGHANCAEGQN